MRALNARQHAPRSTRTIVNVHDWSRAILARDRMLSHELNAPQCVQRLGVVHVPDCDMHILAHVQTCAIALQREDSSRWRAIARVLMCASAWSVSSHTTARSRADTSDDIRMRKPCIRMRLSASDVSARERAVACDDTDHAIGVCCCIFVTYSPQNCMCFQIVVHVLPIVASHVIVILQGWQACVTHVAWVAMRCARCTQTAHIHTHATHNHTQICSIELASATSASLHIMNTHPSITYDRHFSASLYRVYRHTHTIRICSASLYLNVAQFLILFCISFEFASLYLLLSHLL